MKKIVIVLFLFILGYLAFSFFQSPERLLDFNSPKIISLNDNGFTFVTQTSATTVDNFLTEKKIRLGEYDQIIPGKDSALLPGANIKIRRAVKIKIVADGKTIEVYTLQNTIGRAISENNINLGRLDKTLPDVNAVPQEKMEVIVTRINVEEKIIPEDIDFKIISTTDPKLGWREEKITQKGEKGIREIKYKITYKNGKEVSRIALEKNITQDPVPQISTKGTYMELGKAAKGQGTWYAYMGGLFAASTTLPKGSYAKVTNTATGKSVVVQINDYGPQGKGRIIDLDKIAFAKIASLGAGVIGVKVEPVLN